MSKEQRIAELEAEVARLRRANDTLIDALAIRPVIVNPPPVYHPVLRPWWEAPVPFYQQPYTVTCDTAIGISDNVQWTSHKAIVAAN